MKDWLLPSSIITGIVLVIGALMGSLNTDILVSWAVFSAQAGLLILGFLAFRALRKDQSALTAIPKAIPAVPMLVLGGLATPAYNSIKTFLNQFGFWADPAMATIDTALFGWLYIEPLSNTYTSYFYFSGWLAALLLTLIFVPLRDKSLRRDALIVGYFILWCVLSPLVQWALPAGGPIFYERLGHGDLFADYPFATGTIVASDYLWAAYGEGISAFSTGISAMPSLHVASSAWIAMVWYRTKLFPAALAYAVVIFVLSVSLGWHYAIDGIVGAGLALASYAMAKKLLTLGAKPVEAPIEQGLAV